MFVVEDIKKQIADRIKENRIKIYGTQGRLAKQIGKPQATISRWESGDQTPSYENLVLLAGAYGKTVAEFVNLPFVTPPMPDERMADA
jgi:transcriptional regulator with XRE-family HTH domain